VGYPAGAGGFLTSGGSLATLTAVITARYTRLGEQFLDAVLYVSEQSHLCVCKVARLAGIPDEKLDLATYPHERLSTIDALSILAPPELTALTFACRGDVDLEESNARSKRLL
jgi:Zn-dependent oligopeptidase|tara:strand:- start:310 stop:648 length:339 start_codon:yes stop_codon:yes gene_type:complete